MFVFFTINYRVIAIYSIDFIYNVICVHHLFVLRLDFVSFVLSAMLLYVYTIYLFIHFRVDFVSFVFSCLLPFLLSAFLSHTMCVFGPA